MAIEVSIEQAVRNRYAAGAQVAEAALCCPVDYDPRYLAILPQEIMEKDYGCGDPSRYLRPGETVLDLGSGTGKICYIASQVVVSNCVLNLVQDDDKRQLFGEIFRVLRKGGRSSRTSWPMSPCPRISRMTRTSGAAVSPARSKNTSSCKPSPTWASTGSKF